jgi:precorrin-6Y C5,15-methyltransferase (decarboxylating)
VAKGWEKIYIVGIGDTGLAGLSQAARSLVQQADLVFGAENTLARVPELDAEKVPIRSDWTEVCRRLSQERGRRRIVVLATGDPLFYGVARFLCERLEKDWFEVIPHVSTMQLAFARVKESWEDAYLCDLGQRNLEDVLDRVRTAAKVGLFTSDQWPPSRVARTLLEARIDYFRAYVCENLGSPDERVTQGELSDIAEMSFSPLNVMILVRSREPLGRGPLPVPPLRFANPDHWFAQSPAKEGLITHAEVRAIALGRLGLTEDSIVWDVGAGTGSVAIEAAQLAPRGKVYAIERDPYDFDLIRANAERFGVSHVIPVHGSAPEALRRLPDPDAVFVGATSRELVPILEEVYRRLRPGGHLVVHVATVENLTQALASLRHVHEEPDVCLIQISRGLYQLGTIRFDPLTPSFLITVRKHT